MSGFPRKKTKPTATTKAHRFEPFTKRISKIKIDPVHTVQKSRITDDHTDITKSFFRCALDEWADLNLTATFSDFLRQTSPLSESLPQLLHHADSIFELLISSIEKRDELSLEPLLSLLAHLAHDLGYGFVKYFDRTTKVVANVSTTVNDPAVIEQCFTCLAWMFKYLSKQLVQDLRPLLKIMIPYMYAQKEYVRRFSAESLAYLVRKAATLYQRRQESLQLALSHLFAEIGAGKKAAENEAYENALMTLLVETAQGIDISLHSSAADLISCAFFIVAEISDSASKDLATSVLSGCITALIHQTNELGFRPLLETIFKLARSSTNHYINCSLIIKLLLVSSATRRGSRVGDWSSLIKALQSQVTQTSLASEQLDPRIYLAVYAAILAYAPMDQLLPYVNEILDFACSGLSPVQYFSLCEMVADIGEQRFRDLVLPHLQLYITSNWKRDESGLHHLLSQLKRKQYLFRSNTTSSELRIPIDWQQHAVSHLSKLNKLGYISASDACYIQLLESVETITHDETRDLLLMTLSTAIRNAMSRTDGELPLSVRLTLGWALQLYLKLNSNNTSSLWNKLARQHNAIFTVQPFMDACLLVVGKLDKDEIQVADDALIRSHLVDNMLNDNVELRTSSLRILNKIADLVGNVWLSDTIEILLELVETPYLPSNSRKIAMLIRKLPTRQSGSGVEQKDQRLIPLFCMGMLRSYHDQSRKEMCAALKKMASDSSVENIILEIATQWLQTPTHTAGVSNQRSDDEKRTLSPFECSNLKRVWQIARDDFDKSLEIDQNLDKHFREVHSLHPTRTPADSRTIALQLLLEMPEIAERRSRILIPIWLSTTHRRHASGMLESVGSASSHTISPETDNQMWSNKDRALFLELISQFKNPKSLFRSDELYDDLIELLANGNPGTRKVAFDAILNWKDKTHLLYRDVLFRVAEEKSAFTELSAILNTSDEDTLLKPQDRDSILPLLLRLVFGQLIGRSNKNETQESKRKSILRLVSRMDQKDISLFLSIALGRLRDIPSIQEGKDSEHFLDFDLPNLDQQYGFLRMLLSMLETMQVHFEPYGDQVVVAVLYCTISASKYINGVDGVHTPSLIRNIQRNGIRCLTFLFELCPSVDWNPYLSPLFANVIYPKLSKLAIETAQGVSALLRLITCWASHAHLIPILSSCNADVLYSLWSILENTFVRDVVKIFVFESVVLPLAEIAPGSSRNCEEAARILRQEANNILSAITAILQQQPSKEILVIITRAIPQLALYTVNKSGMNQVLETLVSLLCQPNQKVPPHVKSGLLQATESLLAASRTGIPDDSNTKLWKVVADFYYYFKDQANRDLVGRVLNGLCGENDATALQAVNLCISLNANSEEQLDVVDYDRRIAAFTEIMKMDFVQMSEREVLPILQNLLYFCKAIEDFSIRSHATSCLRRIVRIACASQNTSIHSLVPKTILPAIKRGLREDSEIVRADFVSLLGCVINDSKGEPRLQNMNVLLVRGDDEASFFANILHIQQHRRLRAIRRLVNEVANGNILPFNIEEYFLPLLEKFISDDSGDESANSIKGQSILAMSTLLEWVDWKTFRRLFRQYKQDLESTSRSLKDSVKLLDNASNALVRAMEMIDVDVDVLKAAKPLYLASTLPAKQTVYDELRNSFLPSLGKLSHYRDEAELSIRIPAAKIAIKLAKIFPSDELSTLAAPILLDVSQILRSRAQESRDVARNTLAEMVVLLGPSSVHFVLKELRTALTRGYQLHVLSFTVHTILLALSPQDHPGELDYCVNDLVAVIMDDIFGSTGQEKENQDYISSMKEVKSNKSFDSMELLAKSTSVKFLSRLLAPFNSLFTGSLSTKQIKYVDDLLRRIGAGISHNAVASSRDLLKFAHELITSFYQEASSTQSKIISNSEANRQRFLVQLESDFRAKHARSSSLLYKIPRFALDIVRSTMLRHLSLLTAENVHGFLPIIGDALVQGQEDVKLSAFRLLSAIIKLPLKELDDNAELYIMEAMKVVKAAANTSAESSQAALKFLAAILRERQNVEIREADLAYLLHRIMPDLEEPDRQGVTFNLIKATMARKFQLPEIYELVDKVGMMMVTNHTKNTRDAARGVFVHFLIEYPQSEKRWSKQLKFLVKNLEYEYPEGRQSVMEAVHALLQKVDRDMTDELVSIFFMPTILRMANDDHSQCREMAGALVSQLFNKSGPNQLDILIQPLREWIDQRANANLIKLGLQTWKLVFNEQAYNIRGDLPHIKTCVRRLLPLNANDHVPEAKFHALELLKTLANIFPEVIMSNKDRDIWNDICIMLSSEHTWIQSSALDLLNIYFCDSTPELHGNTWLSGSHGLKFSGKMISEILRNLIQILDQNTSSQEVAEKVAMNLRLLGNVIKARKMEVSAKASSQADDAEESTDDGDAKNFDSSETNATSSKVEISVIQYLFDQMIRIIRKEPNKFTTEAFLPRTTALKLLLTLSNLSSLSVLPTETVTALLIPLTYITDLSTRIPRSGDVTFAETYNTYTESAQLLLEALQTGLGDATFIDIMAKASKKARQKRDERRQKRAIERVAEPEKAAKDKRRKVDRKKLRKKEIQDIYRKGRRRDLGF